MSGSGGPIGRREVAVRCFAAEYDDASLEYSESEEERAPNYVVTPTGARINRLFVVGVLTEVESVSDDVLRGRVVDPTGAFVVYAGQYQPDAKTALERAEPPAFVAVTGKARTFEPDDGDRVYTSIRPESINVVDADTRDRWTVQAAEQTIERVGAFAAALEREERGRGLTEVLLESGVDPALASGIPRAIEHYGTTGAYLAAVRERALQAAAVVAGEREEVDALELAPGEGGSVETDLTAGVTVEAASASSAGEPVEGAATSPDSVGATAATSEPPDASDVDEAGAGETATGAGDAEADVAEAESDEAEVDPEPAVAGEVGGSEPAESSDDELGDFDEFGAGDEGGDGKSPASVSVDATSAVGDAGTGDEGTAEATAAGEELYEMDEEEREAIEEEFGTEFSTGSEVAEPGEADIETPGPDEGSTEDEVADVASAAPAAPEDEPAAPGDEAGFETAEAEGQTDAGDADAVGEEGDEVSGGGDEVDLQDAVVDTMADLDEGDGADREAVIEAVVDGHGAHREAVEDAIQDALMGGRCYEPEDGRLKAI